MRQQPHQPTLQQLGLRICIMGPSNSGKSTLAAAIAQATGCPAIHLDQLFHHPHTDWQPRPEAEFITLHDQAIRGNQWVIDGNYSRCLPQRLARATGFILLDVPTLTSLFRYLRRSWFQQDRIGGLNGGQDTVKWDMIHHIAIATRTNRKRYKQLYDRITLPKITLPTPQDRANFYRSANLTR